MRQQRDLLVADVGLPHVLLRVDERRLRGDRHGLGDAANGERELDGQHLAESKIDRCDFAVVKP